MAAFYTFEDLSGPSETGAKKTDNPYHDLISNCNNDPAQIQLRYDTHRTTRNAQQREKLLAPDFGGVAVDEILSKLEDSKQWPGFEDPRNCLVFWARPPGHVKTLVAKIQERLKTLAPKSLWTTPQSSLHMTALEITHSRSRLEIEALVATLMPSAPDIVNHTLQHRVRVVKPIVSFDAQAVALSFLPAAGEPVSTGHDASYTYHHLRRDLFQKASAAGVTVASRYVIPSAHLTIGRFVNKQDFLTTEGEVDHATIGLWVDAIDELNRWLMVEFWPKAGSIKPGGEWVIGEERGLDFRMGPLWYGGGETKLLGKGF